MAKQPVLKPQDLLVALKLGANPSRDFTFAQLAEELHMSISEAHAAARRASTSRLIRFEEQAMKADTYALEEFVFHGVPYTFPPVLGGYTRGMPTGSSGPALAAFYPPNAVESVVWPQSIGTVRGLSLTPLYSSAPTASMKDQRLYELLTIVDAVRVGSARDRELAAIEFRKRLL